MNCNNKNCNNNDNNNDNEGTYVNIKYALQVTGIPDLIGI